MIPPEIVEQVRQKADIVDIIGQYVPLKRAGINYKGLSPFTQEKTPSFMVSPARQSFKCYSSGHGGDVFKFLMLHENLEFPEAIRRIAEKVGVIIPEYTGGGKNSTQGLERSVREKLERMHYELMLYWQERLLKDPRAEHARKYLHSRKIPNSWITDYNLGYALEDWHDIENWGKAQGFTVDEMLQGGLLIKNEEGKIYGRFRDRLMFAIRKDTGQVIAFSGRILRSDPNAPKYINSPETVIFKKSRILFGLERAKRPILDAGEVIICEGQLDVLRCHSAGILNVVAPLGTAFTEEHSRVLKRLADKLTLCLDADRAGQNTTERLGEMLLSEKRDALQGLIQFDLGIKVVRLPKGEDPDSLIAQQGASAFKQRLAQAVDYLDFYIDHITARHSDGSPQAKRHIAESLASLLNLVPNAVSRDHLLAQASVRVNIPVSNLKKEIQRLQSQRPSAHAKETPASAPVATVTEVHPLLRDLILILISSPELIADTQRSLPEQLVLSLSGGDCYQRIVDSFVHDEWKELADLFHLLPDADQNWLAGVSIDALHTVPLESKRQMIQKIALQMELENVSQELALLTEKLRATPSSAPDYLELTQHHFSCIQRKSNLTKKLSSTY